MKHLIIGLGFGQMYRDIYQRWGHQVITVDPDPEKQATHKSVEDALDDHAWFDSVNICSPVYMHLGHAVQVSNHSDCIVVEKPGFGDPELWRHFCKTYGQKIIMTKNNQFRDDIHELAHWYSKANFVSIQWNNKNRVPGPGTWFTQKRYAGGGVSYDLTPHLLSLVFKLHLIVYGDFEDVQVIRDVREQRVSLDDAIKTSYGRSDPDGVLDVDTYHALTLSYPELTVSTEADWATDLTKTGMHFSSGTTEHPDFTKFLGDLCPEYAYENMMKFYIENHKRWFNYQQDMKIQEVLYETG